jgi:dolichyl-phosphate-mannose-protein mannosyltransferase
MRSKLTTTVATPLGLLAVVSVLSLAARVALLGEPCRQPCRAPSDHILVFDESYYVNAARVIAGIEPPVGATYAGTPLGDDPNAEHPQLAKLVMAGSIELFGDGPLAWRLGSLVCGSLAILAMYALVRAAGGGEWLALGAATLMALDNLVLIAGRIGILDIYALAAMLWGTALYLRGRPLAAGAVYGVGACCKEVAPYALLALAIFEGLRLAQLRGRERDLELRGLWRLAACAAATAVVFVGLLAILDALAPPFDATTGKALTGGAFAHIAHILSYGASQTSPHGPQGIASYPWEWLVDLKPITYLLINPAHPGDGLFHIHPAAHFLGFINPVLMLLALPALALAAYGVARGVRAGRTNDLQTLAVAWFVGTWGPFLILSALLQRTSYVYYMIIVMPAIYLAVALLIARLGPRRRLVLAWMVALVAAAVVLWPFTPLPF